MKTTEQIFTIEQVSRITQTYNFVPLRTVNSNLSNTSRKFPVALLCALLNTASPVPVLATPIVDFTSVVLTTNSALQATTESEEFRRMVRRARQQGVTKKQKVRSQKVSELQQEVSLYKVDFEDSPILALESINQQPSRVRVKVRSVRNDSATNIILGDLTAYNVDSNI